MNKPIISERFLVLTVAFGGMATIFVYFGTLALMLH
jgi:hypothetical protein